MSNYSLFRACARVDLGVIRQNLENIISALGEGAQCVGVIKADAYGHGAIPVARAIEDLVSAYAVATPDEALEIRSEFPDKSIFILGYSNREAYPELIDKGIHVAIFSLEDAISLSECALSLGKKALVNIKLDTGMGRIGFDCSENSAKQVGDISRLEGIDVYGIFTHFSCADSLAPSDVEFSKGQYEKLTKFIDLCASCGVTFRKVSVSNSAAIIEMPGTHKDLVRAGILMYGYYPSDEVSRKIKVRPALSLISHIVQIKEVESSFAIGYGRSFITDRPMRIATIPVGYGDGYPRALSGKGRVLINGKYAPIVGRVCMDMFMVDVTHIPEAEELCEAVLLGSQGENSIDADEIARLTDTISYEIICDIGKRVPRVYK